MYIAGCYVHLPCTSPMTSGCLSTSIMYVAPDFHISVRRMPQRARRGEELVRRELMSECAFKPKIKGLPQVLQLHVFFPMS